VIIQVRVLSLSDDVTTFLKREDETFLTQFLTPNMPKCQIKNTRQRRFAECQIKNTRQRSFFAECQNKTLGKGFFVECQIKTLGKAIFQTMFWCPKRLQIKKFLTTKFYNFSRSTNFILIISSFGKVIIMLLTKSISLM
jgi:hypothetical protein